MSSDPFKEITSRFDIIEANQQKILQAVGAKPKASVMTAKMICNEFHISKGTIYNARKRGLLVPLKIGALIRYKRKDIEDWINGK